MTTILLVEDNKNRRLLYEQELRFEGYEIVTAEDGGYSMISGKYSL